MPLRLLNRLEETIIAALLAAATLIVFLAVVQRYGLSNAVAVMSWAKSHGQDWLAAGARAVFLALNSVRLTWAQEACIFLIVWMAKFGAAYGVRTGIHVGVDVLVERLEGRARSALILIALMAGALFTAVVGTLGADLVRHLADTGQTSAVLELPMWIVYLCVPLGSYLMCFRFLEAAWRFWRTGDLPRHAAAEVEGLEPRPEPAAK